MSTLSPFARPMYVMAKPVGARCNLACTYCYYTEKANLYRDDPRHVMSESLLERFVQQYIEMQTGDTVCFTWHGGEPLMRPIAFYKKALALQRRYAGGRRIENALQTNGTLITPEWAQFLRDEQFLVGVSIDGPRAVHDRFRRTRTGRPTHYAVEQGLALLERYGVEWNAMAVVNSENMHDTHGFYQYFKQRGCRYIQFTPVVERAYAHSDGRHLASPIAPAAGATVTPFSVTPEGWGEFCVALFDEWVKSDVGETFVQLFDATLAAWMGVEGSLCALGETCGHAAALEFNGDVYACDHFVFPEFRLGNITERTLTEMMYSPAQQRFGAAKRDALTGQCRACPYLFACHGECPRNRFAFSHDGEAGHNYLCAGYQQYFAHVAPYMDFMKYRLQHEQPPADVMEWIRQGCPPYRGETAQR